MKYVVLATALGFLAVYLVFALFIYERVTGIYLIVIAVAMILPSAVLLVGSMVVQSKAEEQRRASSLRREIARSGNPPPAGSTASSDSLRPSQGPPSPSPKPSA